MNCIEVYSLELNDTDYCYLLTDNLVTLMAWFQPINTAVKCFFVLIYFLFGMRRL